MADRTAPSKPQRGRSARVLLAALGCAAAAAPGSVAAQRVDLGLELAAEARVFPEGPAFAGQTTAAVSPSLSVRPEARLEFAQGAWRLGAECFLRVDAHDGRRTHADIRQLGVAWRGDHTRFFIGAGRVFWGVTEVRHLVDIVNQTDAIEDLDEEDKLGQPMARATFDGGWGALDVMVLPWFRERTYPAPNGRLRGPLPVSGEPVYGARNGRWHPDLAVRWYRTTGALDVGVSYFRGTAREPRLVPAPEGTVLVPHYDLIDQGGVDAQWTGGATLLKLEAIARGGHGDRFVAATAGVEHTLFGVAGSQADLGLLLEVMLDRRTAMAPVTLFDHDIFVGARWARNDVAGSAVLGGAVVDWEHGETLVMAEADRRFGSSWKAALEVRFFAGTAPGLPAHALRRDGFVNLRLIRFF
jgi:hypothetical protein